MTNPEAIVNTDGQDWDMSNIPFAGEQKESAKKTLSEALRYSNELLGHSEIFGDSSRTSHLTESAMYGNNEDILENIKNLDNGRYKINYGTDDFNKGFTGLSQVSGALDYFDTNYGEIIDNPKTKGFIKTCIAMWPMGNVGSFGVREFAKSAKIDEDTAHLVSMVIDRNSMKLVKARFEDGNNEAGEQLLKVNKDYLIKIKEGPSSGYEEREAITACNIQKIIMDCEKNGAEIAKERKIKTQSSPYSG